jgi:hypothetical protein
LKNVSQHDDKYGHHERCSTSNLTNAYHCAHFVLLGKYKCGALQKLALEPGDAETTRDYAERLTFEFEQEIMSQHFGDSRDMSMEGSSVKTFTAEDIKLFQEGLVPLLSEAEATMDFHSHFLDVTYKMLPRRTATCAP